MHSQTPILIPLSLRVTLIGLYLVALRPSWAAALTAPAGLLWMSLDELEKQQKSKGRKILKWRVIGGAVAITQADGVDFNEC